MNDITLLPIPGTATTGEPVPGDDCDCPGCTARRAAGRTKEDHAETGKRIEKAIRGLLDDMGISAVVQARPMVAPNVPPLPPEPVGFDPDIMEPGTDLANAMDAAYERLCKVLPTMQVWRAEGKSFADWERDHADDLAFITSTVIEAAPDSTTGAYCLAIVHHRIAIEQVIGKDALRELLGEVKLDV